MSSMNTKGYTKKNTPTGGPLNNDTTMVKGFAATKNLTQLLWTKTKVPKPEMGSRPISRALLLWKSYRSSLRRPVPMLWEQMRNEPSAVPAPTTQNS